MKSNLSIALLVIAFFTVSCNNHDKVNEEKTGITDEVSPYFGWFKNKKEFSFTTVSISSGVSHGMTIENKVTSYFYVKNGKEAVQEMSEMKVDGLLQPKTEKIYITSRDGNFVINPITKVYYKEAGDFNAVMFSKVWLWTRKRSDSYDALSTNSSATKTTETLNAVNVECFTISGVKFYFGSDKKLLKYKGYPANITVEISFSNYAEGNVPGFIEETISKIEKEGYSLSNTQIGV